MALLNNLETIILDLDGPLLDGKLRHYQCYSDILTARNYVPINLEEYWQGKRNALNRRKLLQQSAAELIYDEFLQTWLQTIEEKIYLQQDRLQKNVLEILQFCNQQGIKLVLATLRQNNENLHWQLTKTLLLPYFSQVIAVNPGTAKATAIKSILPNFDKQKMIWIGDTEVDVQAARELGIPVCAVSCGLRDAEYLSNLTPDYLEPDLYTFACKYLGFHNCHPGLGSESGVNFSRDPGSRDRVAG